MTKKKIILLGGRIDSGKNTVYDYINENYTSDTNKIERVYFAQPIKMLCDSVFTNYNEHVNQVLDDTEKILRSAENKGYLTERAIENNNLLRIESENWYENKTESSRILLQTVGTDIIRNTVDKNYWVNKASKQIMLSDADTFVTTDFRYPNELYHLYSLLRDDYTFYTVNLSRNETIDTDKKINQHESENAFIDFYEWNYILRNDNTLEDLHYNVKTMMEDIMSED